MIISIVQMSRAAAACMCIHIALFCIWMQVPYTAHYVNTKVAILKLVLWALLFLSNRLAPSDYSKEYDIKNFSLLYGRAVSLIGKIACTGMSRWSNRSLSTYGGVLPEIIVLSAFDIKSKLESTYEIIKFYILAPAG